MYYGLILWMSWIIKLNTVHWFIDKMQTLLNDTYYFLDKSVWFYMKKRIWSHTQKRGGEEQMLTSLIDFLHEIEEIVGNMRADYWFQLS